MCHGTQPYAHISSYRSPGAPTKDQNRLKSLEQESFSEIDTKPVDRMSSILTFKTPGRLKNRIMSIIRKVILFASLSSGWALAALSQPPPNAITVNPGTNAIQLAVNKLKHLKGDQHIFINPGVYSENVHIKYKKGGLVIEGATSDAKSFAANTVVITSKVSRKDADHNKDTAAMVVEVDHFVMKNINITNTFGNGAQALALSTKGSLQVFKACSFDGFQDTILLRSGKQYLEGCNIQGNDDFIFGSSRAFFDGCTIGVKPGANGVQVITAHRHYDQTEDGIFVFNKCVITPLGPVAAGSTFLGRPWRSGARVAFQFCRLPGIINPAGWKHFYDDKDPKQKTENSRFYEYQNVDIGANLAGRKLLLSSTKSFDRQSVLGTDPSTWPPNANTGQPGSNPKVLKSNKIKRGGPASRSR